MDTPSGQKCVMIIAGDVSGDLHGARLVRAMRQKDPHLFFFGIGGRALRDAGVRIVVDTSRLSVVGVTEIFSKLPVFLRAMYLAKQLFKTLHPDLLILIDFPGFNLPVSAIAKKHGVRILYYISPQVWAWREGRVNKIRRRIDHMAVILPFEETFYTKHRVPATYVGHPLLDVYADTSMPPEGQHRRDTPVIGLLPGSREKEITRLLPVMMDAAEILSRRNRDLRFEVSVSASVDPGSVETMIRNRNTSVDYTLSTDPVSDIFSRCTLSVVASGTVTLEAALCGMPMVIIYKVSPLTSWLGRALIHVDHIGLVNLIAGKGLVPELIQKDASGEIIADNVWGMLEDPHRLDGLRRDLRALKAPLGGAGAAERTADIALGMI